MAIKTEDGRFYEHPGPITFEVENGQFVPVYDNNVVIDRNNPPQSGCCFSIPTDIKSEFEIRQKITELQNEFETRDRSGDGHCQSKPLILLQRIKALKWVISEDPEL